MINEQSEWIPCVKMQPKKAGYYHVTKILFKGAPPIVGKEYFHPSSGWADSEHGETVIAWRHKLKPWNEELEEDRDITVSDLIKHLQKITNQQGKIPLHITIENLLRRKI